MKYLYPYLLFICLSATAFAQLPLAIRVDQAKTQLQNHIDSKDFTGALPWLEKLVALQDEGYIMPSIMNYYAGQIYLKTGNQKAASTYLEKYVANENGKFFWDALTMYSQIEPLKTKAVLEKYLSQNNPPEYQNALDLYTKVEQLAKIKQEKEKVDSLEQVKVDSLAQIELQSIRYQLLRTKANAEILQQWKEEKDRNDRKDNAYLAETNALLVQLQTIENAVEIAPSEGVDATILFNSLPAMAEIYVDGTLVGKTNVQPVVLKPGSYSFVFKKEGMSSKYNTTLRSGKNIGPMIRLE